MVFSHSHREFLLGDHFLLIIFTLLDIIIRIKIKRRYLKQDTNISFLIITSFFSKVKHPIREHSILEVLVKAPLRHLARPSTKSVFPRPTPYTQQYFWNCTSINGTLFKRLLNICLRILTAVSEHRYQAKRYKHIQAHPP